MKRRCLRIYRKRRKKKLIILILTCILFLGTAAAERGGYLELEQFGSNKKQDIPYQKVSITEEENTEKYYYQQLPTEQRQVYQEILEGVRNHTEEIYVHNADVDETNQIFQKLMKDQPDIFWCDGTATATTYKGTESYTVLKPKYFYTAEESQKMQTAIMQAAEKWLADLDADADDYHKILYVYEKIVDEVEYDESAPDNQNIYSVFVNQKSVCAGYSKATQYLLERLGVFCTYVTGKTTEGGNHAWNLVKCNGDYYYVDTTWEIRCSNRKKEKIHPGMQSKIQVKMQRFLVIRQISAMIICVVMIRSYFRHIFWIRIHRCQSAARWIAIITW